MWALLRTEGEMKLHELYRECQLGSKWAPLLAYEKEGQTTTIICFEFQDIAKKFSKRNLPKSHLTGAVQLATKDIEWLLKKGLRIEVLNFPKLVRDRTDIKLTTEVLEFQSAVEVKEA